MDTRTYDAINGHMSQLQQALAENERLHAELACQQDMATQAIQIAVIARTERNTACDMAEGLAHDVARLDTQLSDALQHVDTLRADAADLGKALNMALAERDAAYAELDAQTLKADSFRGELHRYIVHARELKEMLDISVAEKDTLRAELVDAET